MRVFVLVQDVQAFLLSLCNNLMTVALFACNEGGFSLKSAFASGFVDRFDIHVATNQCVRV